MPYTSANDIINDALFRSGEIPGASEWDVQALNYLNRTYQAICSGASELLPEFIEDWWWLRANGVITVLPTIQLGSVSVIEGTKGITFSQPIIPDIVGYRFKVADHPDVFVIESVDSPTQAIIDSFYTGVTNASASYELLKVVYDLPVTVAAIMSPVVSFRENPQIMGTTPERLDTLWPLARLSHGVPQAFALESETQLRFSHGGLREGKSMRMEFRYRPAVDPLVNLANSIPLLPLQWRQILSDTTTMYIMLDKNDDRATSVGQAARSGLTAMAKENRRRLAKMDQYVGKIIPRQSNTRASWEKRLRTESGFIVG